MKEENYISFTIEDLIRLHSISSRPGLEFVIKNDYELLLKENDELNKKNSELSEYRFNNILKATQYKNEFEKLRAGIIPIFKWLLGYSHFPDKGNREGNFYWRGELSQDLRKIGIEPATFTEDQGNG